MLQKAWKLLRNYREIILYLIFGGLTTLVNLVVFWLLMGRMGSASTLVPTAVAWVISVLFAYLTNRRWVFQSRASGGEAILREMGSFFGGRVLTGLLDLAIMYLAVDILGAPATPTKLLSNVLVILLNYIISKLWVFRKTESGSL